jgi:Na+/H+-dicarboxylate symporter
MLLPIDWFLDRCRTAVNIMGDVTVSCVLDGRTRGGGNQPPSFTPHAQTIETGVEVGIDHENRSI